ncbi:MAG: hypothetical protein JWP63_2851 [Candidatus Solibacter sp.]|jgi:hypothetical protein|nr:hypothetical protein [Candidatus Solibacter sp.]
MSDTTAWKLRGPVRTLKTESATHHFRRDGSIAQTEHHNPDGSISLSTFLYDSHGRLTESQFQRDGQGTSKMTHFYDDAGRRLSAIEISADNSERVAEESTYDARGRKTTRRFLPPQLAGQSCSYAIEGTDHSYSAPDATAMTVHHNERGLPDEANFHDAAGALVARVTFERDAAGRLLAEEYRLFQPLPDLPPEIMQLVFGADRTFSRTTYAYDENDRVFERNTQMGILSESSDRFRYDEYGNPIEQISEQTSREMQIDDDGQPHAGADRSTTQHSRLACEYDAQGNWTRREVWGRIDPNTDFEPTVVEHRLITYHSA